jgi:hypothetical protein
MFLTVRRQTFCSSNVIESMVVVSGNSMTGTQYMNNLAGKSLTVNRLGLGNLTEAFNAADTNGDGEVSQDEFENSNNSILMIDMKIMNLIDCKFFPFVEQGSSSTRLATTLPLCPPVPL